MSRIPAAAIFILALAVPAAAKDCRVPDAPPGVRLTVAPGCQPAARKPAAEPALRAGSERGFVRTEGGTEIRIGGRVRVDALGSR